jgi:hypothetical protein
MSCYNTYVVQTENLFLCLSGTLWPDAHADTENPVPETPHSLSHVSGALSAIVSMNEVLVR